VTESVDTHRRITRSALIRLLGRAAGGVLTLVALHYATRYFGPTRWGSIAAALAWVGVFVALGPPGVATMAMREGARPGVDRETVFGTALAATALVGLAGAVIAAGVGVGVYWTRPVTLVLVAVLSLTIPCTAIFQTASSELAAVGRNDVRAVLDVGSSVVGLVATLVVVREALSSKAYAVAMVASIGVSTILALAVAAARVRPRFHSVGTDIRPFIRSSIPLGQVDLFSAVYARADSLLLYFVKGPSAIALYAVAYQVAAFVMSMPVFLTGALLPDFMAAKGARRTAITRHGFNIVMAVALPLPLFFGLFGRPFLLALSGEKFAGAAVALTVLSGAAALVLVNGYLFQLSVYAGAEAQLWRAIAIVTVVNLVAIGIAVPFWGIDGAAAAMVLSELAGMTRYWPVFRRATGYRLDVRHLACVIGATAVIAGGWLALHLGLGLRSGQGPAMVLRAGALAAAYLIVLKVLTFVIPRSPDITEPGVT